MRKYFDLLTVEAGQEGGGRKHHNYCYVFKLDGYLAISIISYQYDYHDYPTESTV